MKKIGINANTEKELALSLARDVNRRLRCLGAIGVYDALTAAVLGETAGDFSSVEALIVIGGDGTVLNCAEWAAQNDVPLLGVNMGNIGFLNNVEANDLDSALARLVADEYFIHARLLLQGSMEDKNRLALNDFLLFKEHYSHTIQVAIDIDDVRIANFACDGVLVSSPTGSTAYSLSAGGPIVAPNVNAILITPVCPHTLSARPMLVGENDVVSLRILQGHCNRAQISADGIPVFEKFELGHILRVGVAKQRLRFICVNGHNFFERVRNKLY